MSPAELLATNLFSPMVLAFALGMIATLLRSDLKLPEGLYTSLSIYLLFAIGLKGGVALSQSTPADLWKPALATVVLGIVTAYFAFLVAQRIGKLDTTDAAAMAAHYGSVSAVTFIAALNFAEAQGFKIEGTMPAFVALMEIPAIMIGLGLAGKQLSTSRREMVRELLTGKTILLLIGGLLIGLVSGAEGVKQVTPLFGDLFKGALTIFLLEMGLVAAERFDDIKKHAKFLVSYGICVPLFNGTLGVAAGTLAGLSVGGSGILGAMAASASYIAAPAAVRMALPKANPSLYLTGALGITFPFNLVFGIPIYMQLAKWMH